MKLAYSIVVAAIVATVLPLHQARAASAMMCAAPNTAQGGRQIADLPSGKTYSLNAAGCAVFNAIDLSVLNSRGFTPGPALQSIIVLGVSSVPTKFGTLP